MSDTDKYYAYINERIKAGDSRIEVYVTTDMENYGQYMDFSKVDVSKTPLTSVSAYSFEAPEIITTNVWKMIFVFI